jgi:hypothetical protein
VVRRSRTIAAIPAESAPHTHNSSHESDSRRQLARGLSGRVGSSIRHGRERRVRPWLEEIPRATRRLDRWHAAESAVVAPRQPRIRVAAVVMRATRVGTVAAPSLVSTHVVTGGIA